MNGSEILRKTIIYRIIAITLTLLVTYFFTKKLNISIKIAIITELLQSLIYYTYEHFWI
jgi:uncharacterized membrane protein